MKVYELIAELQQFPELLDVVDQHGRVVDSCKLSSTSSTDGPVIKMTSHPFSDDVKLLVEQAHIRSTYAQ